MRVPLQFLGEIVAPNEPIQLPATVEELRTLVATNILRERERCAKIAESWGADRVARTIREDQNG